MARVYEVMFIIRPDVPEDEVEKLITHLEGSVTSSAGTVTMNFTPRSRRGFSLARMKSLKFHARSRT